MTPAWQVALFPPSRDERRAPQPPTPVHTCSSFPSARHCGHIKCYLAGPQEAGTQCRFHSVKAGRARERGRQNNERKSQRRRWGKMALGLSSWGVTRSDSVPAASGGTASSGKSSQVRRHWTPSVAGSGDRGGTGQTRAIGSGTGHQEEKDRQPGNTGCRQPRVGSSQPCRSASRNVLSCGPSPWLLL